MCARARRAGCEERAEPHRFGARLVTPRSRARRDPWYEPSPGAALARRDPSMGYPLTVALRYLASKKRSMISISTALAIGGVLLGVAALTIVMSVTGGFQEQFREKVLGVNAHVLVLKYSIDFREYRDVMKKIEGVPGVVGVAPFVINPMMVTHGERTATGVLLKGVDPELMPKVLDLPKHVVLGSLAGLRRPGAEPPERPADSLRDPLRDVLDHSPPLEGDAGTDSLLQLMRREVDAEMTRDASADPPTLTARAAPPPPPPAPVEPPAAPRAEPRPRTGIAGEVTPTGGYKSRLPDDDNLPDSIDPDPCKSPEQIAKMPGIVIGRTLAKQLAVGLGDCVQVTSPQIGMSFGAGARAADREAASASSRSSRRASTSTTRSSSTPISTRPRPSTSTATASPASR